MITRSAGKKSSDFSADLTGGGRPSRDTSRRCESVSKPFAAVKRFGSAAKTQAQRKGDYAVEMCQMVPCCRGMHFAQMN